jgi:hypothetical protein
MFFKSATWITTFSDWDLRLSLFSVVTVAFEILLGT